jgi:hypothetical protein
MRSAFKGLLPSRGWNITHSKQNIYIYIFSGITDTQVEDKIMAITNINGALISHDMQVIGPGIV